MRMFLNTEYLLGQYNRGNTGYYTPRLENKGTERELQKSSDTKQPIYSMTHSNQININGIKGPLLFRVLVPRDKIILNVAHKKSGKAQHQTYHYWY